MCTATPTLICADDRAGMNAMTNPSKTNPKM